MPDGETPQETARREASLKAAQEKLRRDRAEYDRLYALQQEKQKTNPDYYDSTVAALKDRIAKQTAKVDKLQGGLSKEEYAQEVQHINAASRAVANEPEARKERYEANEEAFARTEELLKPGPPRQAPKARQSVFQSNEEHFKQNPDLYVRLPTSQGKTPYGVSALPEETRSSLEKARIRANTEKLLREVFEAKQANVREFGTAQPAPYAEGVRVTREKEPSPTATRALSPSITIPQEEKPPLPEKEVEKGSFLAETGKLAVRQAGTFITEAGVGLAKARYRSLDPLVQQGIDLALPESAEKVLKQERKGIIADRDIESAALAFAFPAALGALPAVAGKVAIGGLGAYGAYQTGRGLRELSPERTASGVLFLLPSVLELSRPIRPSGARDALLRAIEADTETIRGASYPGSVLREVRVRSLLRYQTPVREGTRPGPVSEVYELEQPVAGPTVTDIYGRSTAKAPRSLSGEEYVALKQRQGALGPVSFVTEEKVVGRDILLGQANTAKGEILLYSELRQNPGKLRQILAHEARHIQRPGAPELLIRARDVFEGSRVRLTRAERAAYAASETPRPIGSSVRLPSGASYTTTRRTVLGRDYYARTTTSPAGERTTKVFRGDVQVGKPVLSAGPPSVRFLEPQKVTTGRQTFSVPETTLEQGATIRQFGAVSNIDRKPTLFRRGSRIVGEGIISEKEKLAVASTRLGFRQSATGLYVDLDEGTVGAESIFRDIVDTRYKFVTGGLRNPKEFSLSISREGIYADYPASYLTRQRLRAPSTFELSTERTPSLFRQGLRRGREVLVALSRSKKGLFSSGATSETTFEEAKSPGAERVRVETIQEEGVVTVPRLLKGLTVTEALPPVTVQTPRLKANPRTAVIASRQGSVTPSSRPTSRGQGRIIIRQPTRITARPISEPIVAPASRAISRPASRLTPVVRPATRTIPSQVPISKPVSVSEPISKSVTSQVPISKSVNVQRIATTTMNIPRSPPTPPGEPPPPPFLTSPFAASSVALPSAGFRPQVRRLGLFGYATTETFKTKEEAFRAGADIVDVTAAASLRVVDVESGQVVTSDGLSFGTRGRFYPSTREKGVLVEKSRFRISTPGEKQEITEKGLAALSLGRKKEKKKRSPLEGIFGRF